METPIELELVGKKDDMYALKYPGLQIPIHVNYELLEKFKKSPDYRVRETVTARTPQEKLWGDNVPPKELRA